MKRKFSGGYRTALMRAGATAYGALRYLSGQNSGMSTAKRIKGARSYTGTRTKRSSGVDKGGISQQHDVITQYVKSYMPKGKKKAWRKFSKKVKYVMDAAKGITTALTNYTFTAENNNASLQSYVDVHLYSNSGSVATQDDLKRLAWADQEMTSKKEISPTNATVNVNALTGDGWISGANKNIRFTSAVLDLTYINTSTGIQEVDVYHIVYRNVGPRPLGVVAGSNSFDGALQIGRDATGFVRQNAIVLGGLGNKVTLQTRGATPFELGGFLSFTGAKILRKEKVFIEPGKVYTKQLRDPRNRTFNPMGYYLGQETGTTSPRDSYIKPGWTQTVLFLSKQQTLADGPVAPWEGTNIQKFEVKATRIYKYNQEGQSEDKSYQF